MLAYGRRWVTVTRRAGPGPYLTSPCRENGPDDQIGASSMAFFEIAAQVIPLLSILIVIDIGLREPQRETEKRADQPEQSLFAFGAVFTILLLFSAEMVSLSVILSGNPNRTAQLLVVDALALAGGLILSYVVSPYIRPLVEDCRFGSFKKRVSACLILLLAVSPLLIGLMVLQFG